MTGATKYSRVHDASHYCIVGVFNGEGPPVPIPNTEVKLTSADNTCLETDREDRSMPTQKAHSFGCELFTFLWDGRSSWMQRTKDMSLRTSDRRHWCGNPFSLEDAKI